MLTLKNITKIFSGTTAVDNISFTVHPGEVVGFLGPNGAGKTTTMRMITGVLEQDSGIIEYDNQDTRNNMVRIKRHLGYMPENNPLYDDMLVCEYLRFMAELKGIEKHKYKQVLIQAAKETEITDVFYRPINELSKGYRQRVGLAQAIMHKPDMLILDEPTEGLDPNQRITIRDLIKNLGAKRTVILSTHVLQEVVATCSRVIIINNGVIVADDITDNLVQAARGKRVVFVEAEGIQNDKRLKNLHGVADVTEEKAGGKRIRYRIIVDGDHDVRPLVFDAAQEEGWRIWELCEERQTLEDVFRELTKEGNQ